MGHDRELYERHRMSIVDINRSRYKQTTCFLKCSGLEAGNIHTKSITVFDTSNMVLLESCTRSRAHLLWGPCLHLVMRIFVHIRPRLGKKSWEQPWGTSLSESAMETCPPPYLGESVLEAAQGHPNLGPDPLGDPAACPAPLGESVLGPVDALLSGG